MWSRAIGSGTKPQPRPRSCASILVCMLLTVSTSWPGSRFTVSGARRCAESATATARWRDQLGVADRLGGGGQRMVRRDREHERHRPEVLHLDARRQHAAGADADGQVGLAGDERLPGAGQHLGAQPQAGRRRRRRRRRRVPREPACAAPRARRTPRTARAAWCARSRRRRRSPSCVSQPVATRLTRLATASICSSRRRPSSSSSCPAAVSGPGASGGRTAARRARPRAGARCRSATRHLAELRARPRRSCRSARWHPSSSALRG